MGKLGTDNKVLGETLYVVSLDASYPEATIPRVPRCGVAPNVERLFVSFVGSPILCGVIFPIEAVSIM